MMDDTSKRRVWLAVLAIFLVAAAVRFSFWFELRGTPLDRWQRFDQSDMATYVEQARRIASGDLLQAEPYHPYHSWQFSVPQAKWLEWYGPHSFHQAPLYSYLLAWIGPVAGEDFALVKAVQLALGAGSCVLLFLITRHLWGFQAGCAAGALAALYGPLAFLEAQLLREGPALFCILAMTYALMRHVEQRQPGTRKLTLTAAALGLAAGAFAMLHELGSVMTLVLLISLAVAHGRSRFKTAAVAVGCATCGWLIGFSPLLARNLAVGAPPFAVSCRTVINFVESNVADVRDGGATFTEPTPNAVAVLDACHRSGLAALGGVWKTYHGDFGAFLTNLGRKMLANGPAREVPDNTSYEFFREHTATLRFAPTFALLFPLGFAGMLFVAWTAASRRRSAPVATKKELKRQRKQAAAIEANAAQESKAVDPGNRLASHLVLLLLFAGLLASLSLVHTVARFRMYLVPVCIVYAGILCATVWQALRERRLGTFAALALCALAGAAIQASLPTSMFVLGVRTVDYAVAGKLAIERGEFDRARKFSDEARVKFPGDGTVDALAGYEFEQKRERELAIEFYRRALAIDPNAQIARDGLRRLQAQ